MCSRLLANSGYSLVQIVRAASLGPPYSDIHFFEIALLYFTTRSYSPGSGTSSRTSKFSRKALKRTWF